MPQIILILMMLLNGNPNIETRTEIYENHHAALVTLTNDESYVLSLYIEDLGQEDFEFFARLVVAEAGHHYDGQVAVAQCVINRVDSERFPDTYMGVMLQSGQFSVVRNGQVNTTATDEARQAIVEAYLYRPHPEDILFFRSIYPFAEYRLYENIGGNYFSYGG